MLNTLRFFILLGLLCVVGPPFLISILWAFREMCLAIEETRMAVFLKTSIIGWIRLILEMAKNIILSVKYFKSFRKISFSNLKTVSSPITSLAIPQNYYISNKIDSYPLPIKYKERIRIHKMTREDLLFRRLQRPIPLDKNNSKRRILP